MRASDCNSRAPKASYTEGLPPRLQLTAVFHRAFPRDVIGRASGIRTSDIVIKKADREGIFARVSGTHIYDTRLTRQETGVALSCSCPYYQRDGACKHLWALLSLIDRSNLLHPDLEAELAAHRYHFQEPEEQPDDEFRLTAPVAAYRPGKAQAPPPPDWKIRLGKLPSAVNPDPPPSLWPQFREILYSLNRSASTGWGNITLRVWTRDLGKAGKWLKPKPINWPQSDIEQIPNPEDRDLLVLLSGSARGNTYFTLSSGTVPAEYALSRELAIRLLPRICGTERCFLTSDVDTGEFLPLYWSPEEWRLVVQVRKEGTDWVAEPLLEREGERRGLAGVGLLEAGLVVAGQSISPIAKTPDARWLGHLRQMGMIRFPETARDEVVSELMQKGSGPRLDIPEEVRFREVSPPLQKFLHFKPAGNVYGFPEPVFRGELRFAYLGHVIKAGGERGLLVPEDRLIVHRSTHQESEAVNELLKLNISPSGNAFAGADWMLPQSRLGKVAPDLLRLGWHVQVDGQSFRKSDRTRTGVSSGIDWFDVDTQVDFGDVTVGIPQLLEALHNGSELVTLPDGSYGLIPDELRERLLTMMRVGHAGPEGIRFHRAHTGLLDALLAAQPNVSVDETFARVRDELARFTGIEPADQPPGFSGQLRDYQKSGLAWMLFLQRFGFGGCLADDMGVGKTAQVLALLETRRQQKDCGPSLVVVPKSLVFNWQDEAARFTPELRVLAHVGMERSVDLIRDYDLVLTTYGTLRRDAPVLRDVEFDYVILDEAQAVKNASSESSKAVRLLRGRHRLAMSGTPIENHLGELWSIFEFLNPGMLEAANIFRGTKKNARTVSEELRPWLAHALRPFLLRRTKQQVAKELPPKMEQTLVCELEPKQRKLYDELRVHYRDSLLGRIDRQGLAKSRMHVLEALLRLRQAACHPGLIDKKMEASDSAKLDLLIDRLEEVTEEGHKALVFSQFTSFLAIVEARMKKSGIAYEYLDGSTSGPERRKRVEKFQTDPELKAFLISLKAGGLGLNLTAADYVFLLDPWWNPAVETQAIDRAHRIGQTQHVFAYRLIAKDTVEEKILELQKTKRDLAAAIVSEDSSIFQSLKREDLEMLLS